LPSKDFLLIYMHDRKKRLGRISMKRLLLVTTCLLTSIAAHAQTSGMQSPAYQECTSLATSNPAQALTKAEAWLKIDSGIAAHHCRAMALFGLRRFAEAGDALSAVRDMITPDNIGLRSYVARQTSQAYMNANITDKALAALGTQINDISTHRGDNANAAKLTADLLLDRARLSVTYGKLEDAAKDLDHAVSLTPVNEEILLERAGVFEKLGDKSLAMSDAQAVIKLNNSNTKARDMMARLSGAMQGSGIQAPAANQATPPAYYTDAAPAAAPLATVTGQPAQPKKYKKRKYPKKVAPITPASEAP
jgi:tetratricopeptide (TPR) repeat protein